MRLGRSSPMLGITEQEILHVFRTILPSDVAVVSVAHRHYMRTSLSDPFILTQVLVGMYDMDTIDEEFLSVARTYPEGRLVEVDLTLLTGQMEDVDHEDAIGYVAQIALHEYHHLTHHHGAAGSLDESSQREEECAEFIETHHPDVLAAARRAEEQSRIISTVHRRAQFLYFGGASRP